MIAWTYDGSIWTNTAEIRRSGCDEVLIRRFEINDGTRDRMDATGIEGCWVETRSAADASRAVAVFGERLRGFYLPDEPNNTRNGVFDVAPDEIGRIAGELRKGVPGCRLWLNITARMDADGHVKAFALAGARTNLVLSAGLYRNCTDDCTFCNELPDIRAMAGTVKTLADRHGIRDLGVIAQGFQMVRCDRPKVTAQYLADNVLEARKVFGDRHVLTAVYAWKADDGFDGEFLARHSDLWPVLADMKRILDKPVVPPPPEVTEMVVKVPKGVKRITLEVER